jgi:hypothetical protein
MQVWNACLVTILLSVFAAPSFACSVIGRISGKTMFSQAEVIVRAKAVNYAIAPSRSVQGMIRFQILETLRGSAGNEVVLPGELVNTDDWNDQPVPYDFVRPMGRGGSCYASFYRDGGTFLLFLKKDKDGRLSTAWYPLGPANEQLKSDTDPWLLWTRNQQRELDQK